MVNARPPQAVMGDLAYPDGELEAGLDWVDHGEVSVLM